MRNLLAFSCVIFFAFYSFSQSEFDIALKKISNDLAGKLKLQDRKKIVVLFVTDINKKTTTAGKYLADNISYNFVNDTMFNVFERESLNSIAEVKNLIEEGYIDAEKSKKLGKILSVNTIIIGNYTVLSNTIKLSLKALSSSNGVTIAASMSDLPLNADAGAILGIKILSPGENASINTKCNEINTGDYCFKNNTSDKLTVTYWPSAGNMNTTAKNFTIAPNQSQCIYDIPQGPLNYDIRYVGNYTYNSSAGKTPYNANGQIVIEKCKSKTFEIK